MSTIEQDLKLLRQTKSDIKSAIEEKGKQVGNIPFSQYPEKIRAIETGTNLPELSNPGTEDDLLLGKQLIDQEGNALTGTIPTKKSTDLKVYGAYIDVPAGYYAETVTGKVNEVRAANIYIDVDKQTGLITASGTQEAGYVPRSSLSKTRQLTTQSAQTIRPSTAQQTAVASGRYTTGDVTVQGDSNLKASNIKDGVSIFGVEGTYTGQNLPSLTTPGTAADLRSGKQLINQSGSIVTGSMPTVTWPEPAISVYNDGTIKVSATQEEGFIAGGDQLFTTQFRRTQLSAGGTFTPTTVRQTIVAASQWTTGYHYMAGDPNLIPGNIRKGISIFNVAGTYEGTATPSYRTFNDITASVNRTLDPTLTFSISPSVSAQQLVACAGMLYITGTAYSPYSSSISLSSTPCIYYYLFGSDAFLYIPTSPQQAYFALSTLNNTNTKISGSTLTIDLSHDTSNSATWYLGVTSARFPGIVKVVYI